MIQNNKFDNFIEFTANKILFLLLLQNENVENVENVKSFFNCFIFSTNYRYS